MIRLSLRGFVGCAVLSAAVGLGCWPEVRTDATRAATSGPPIAHARHSHDHGHVLAGAEALPDRSIYQLEGEWTDAQGRRVRLDTLRGAPLLALLFYGTCQHACPALVHDMQAIEAALEPGKRERTRFLLVSFDPERDTPERLARYASEHGLEAARWTLLHGSPEQIRELALVLGVRYRPSGEGSFNHTMRITLLDADGVIARQMDGLGQDPAPLLAALHDLFAAAGY